MLDLRLLGPVELFGSNGPIDLGGGRPTRLLVALFMADRHRLDLDALVERCFDDNDRPDDARPAIRTAVRRLRRAIGDDLVRTQSGGYELDIALINTDLDRFDELVAAGRAATDPVAAITSYRRALDLWHGTPFGEFGELDWLVAERVRLEASHLVAMEGWHDAHLRNGTVTEIIPSLESATAEHPLRERFQRQLMQALFVADRQADALRAFQVYREAMVEAGLEPGPDAVALEQRIAIGDPTLRAATTGRPLRGYRIAERLGEGAFSIVYRGTQPSVERDVAIKQIRAELANRPDFIRRFDAEARMVAHLEHPFIVPLYDYWREPGSAYLVMRLLTGGSLESSLLDGPWDLDRTSQMVEQVGAALSVAHRSGVVHRDVKSANILLDDEGNSYLTDFGIALTESEMFDPGASLSAGSPAYASPEQLRREPVGPSADVHGLAIAVYEALTGRLPFPDEPTQAALLQRQLSDPIPPVRSTRTDVPVTVDEVLQRATAKAAGERYQSIEDFVAAFEAAAGATLAAPRSSAATLVPSQQRNPYKGLRAFTEADFADFAGRDRLVDQLVVALADNRTLAVVGPSGSGKSSVVRAGLLPALRRGAVSGSADWFVATLFPGANPDEELEAALLQVAATHPPGLLEVLRDGDRGINRALRQVLPQDGQLLLVIDQFEELFTLCDDELQRRRFLDGLAAAVSEERSRLRVVLTLRADFYDRPLRYESIGRLVRDATVPVLPLAADELDQAIAEPARSVGAEFAPGLISEIVADVSDQPGALPLMQYALTELYERRVSNLITRDAYEAIGRVTGALTARAEQLYETSSPDERDTMRRLFGRLVTLGEGTENTRRRVTRRELGSSPTAERVIDRFGGARLLSFDRDPSSREPTVEVAHEALLREWPRLRGWLDEDRDGLRIHRHLTETASAWVASGRDTGELYRGGRLEGASTWAAEHGDDLNDTEREFLGASVSQRTAEEAAERDHLDQQLRSNRRLRVLVAVASVIAVIAAAAGVFALQQRSRAEDNADDATAQAEQSETNRVLAEAASQAADEARGAAQRNARLAAERADDAEEARRRADLERLVAVARTTESADPTVGLLLAVEAHRLEPSVATLDALHRALTARPGFMGSLASDQVGSITVLDDGERLVTHTAATIDVWNVATRTKEASWPYPNPLEQRTSVIYLTAVAAGDGSIVAASDPTGVTVLELASGETLARIDHSSESAALAVSPDHQQLAAGFDDGVVEVWQLGETPRLVAALERRVTVGDLAWRPDGGALAIGTYDGGTVLWDPEADVIEWEDPAVSGPAIDNGSWGLLFSTDGTRLVVSTQSSAGAATTGRASGARVIRVLDAATGGDLVAAIPDSYTRTAIQWRDETERVAIAVPSGSGPLTEFDVVDGTPLSDIGESKSGFAFGLGVLPELGLVASGGSVGIELRSLTGSGPLSVLAPLATPQQAVADPRFLTIDAFTADSRGLVTSLLFPPGGTPFLVDLDQPLEQAEQIRLPESEPQPSIVDGFGEYTFWATPAGVRIRAGVAGAWQGPMIPAPINPIVGISLSRRGDRVLLIERNPVGVDLPVLYDVASGTQVTVLEAGIDFTGPFLGGTFSGDGTIVNITSGFEAASFDAATGELRWATDQFGTAVAGPDGTTMSTSEDPTDPAVRIRRSTPPFEQLGEPLLGHQSGTSWHEPHPDRPWMATGGRDGTVRVWDLDSRTQLGRALPSDQSGTISWSPDGQLLAVPTTAGFVVWNYDTEAWPEIACKVAGRNLTEEEWHEFGPRTIDHRATCN